jgi:hypothetical protein
MAQHIDEMMARLGIAPTLPGTNADGVAEFEREIAAPLPAVYRAFLTRYGGARPAGQIEYPIGEPCPWGQRGIVSHFFGLSDDPAMDIRRAALETYAGRIPDETIPIAEDPGNNLVVLGVEGMVKDKVFFWDHEHREVGGRLDEMAAELAGAGEDLRRYDAHRLIRRWEERFPERRSKPVGSGNVYAVAESFVAFLSSLVVATDRSDRQADQLPRFTPISHSEQP